MSWSLARNERRSSGRRFISLGMKRRALLGTLTVAISLASLGFIAYLTTFPGGLSGLLDNSPNPRVCECTMAVHLTPVTASQVVAQVERGTRVDLLAVTSKSAKIRTPDGCIGFVPRDKLSLPGMR